jgi:hypothetical protein
MFSATWCCVRTTGLPAFATFGPGIKSKVLVIVCGSVTFKGRAVRVEVWSLGVEDTGGGTDNLALLFEAREPALWVLFVNEVCTRRRRGGLAAEGVIPNKLVEGNSAAKVLDRVNAAS